MAAALNSATWMARSNISPAKPNCCARPISKNLPAQREAVRRIAHGVSWTFTLHHTDQSPAKLLMMLHGLVGGAKSRAFDLGGIA